MLMFFSQKQLGNIFIRSSLLGTQVANSIFSTLKSFSLDYGYFPLNLNALFLFLRLFAFSHNVQLQAALTCQFCVFQSTGTTAHGDFSQISYSESSLCCFPPRERSEASKMELCVKMFHSLKPSTVQLASCKYKAPPEMFGWLLF